MFHGVIPALPVADVDEALQYYRDVLGFSVKGRHQNEAGDAIFGSVLRDKVNFYFWKPAEPIGATHCYVFVDEVDDLCTLFKTNGATILEESSDKPWGYRQFTLQDLNGHVFEYFQFSDDVT